MARWQVVPVMMRSIEDEEQRDTLGIASEVRVIQKQATIDLDRVESYAKLIDENGDDDETQTDVWMTSGGYMIIQMPFSTFDKIIRKVK